jgi:hypothetical protein
VQIGFSHFINSVRMHAIFSFNSISVVATSGSKKCVNTSRHRIDKTLNKVFLEHCFIPLSMHLSLGGYSVGRDVVGHFCKAHPRYDLSDSYLETLLAVAWYCRWLQLSDCELPLPCEDGRCLVETQRDSSFAKTE